MSTAGDVKFVVAGDLLQQHELARFHMVPGAQAGEVDPGGKPAATGVAAVPNGGVAARGTGRRDQGPQEAAGGIVDGELHGAGQRQGVGQLGAGVEGVGAGGARW